jgi:hypothetical protein
MSIAEDVKFEDRPALTDTDIVAGLRSEDPNRRRYALDRLFPNEGATLITCRAMSTAVSTSSKIDASRMFVGLLFVAQQLGKVVGLQLNWAQDHQSDAGKIIVPGGM